MELSSKNISVIKKTEFLPRKMNIADVTLSQIMAQFFSLGDKGVMKKYRTESPKKNIKLNTKRQPDIGDDLDNRKHEAQDFKGDDITHNAKYRRNQLTKHK